MKTSKEMQLRILDKMRENVESSKWLFDQIQYSSRSLGWIDKENSILDFMGIEYRIKPETITINGVEIPKPLSKSGVDSFNKGNLLHVVSLAYATKDEAIEASRALFGIED